MFEALENFETAAMHFAPALLLVLGTACVLCGLCLWLGGLRFSKPTAALIGVAAGVLSILLAGQHHVVAFVGMALVGGGFGLFFEKFTLILAGLAITVIIMLFFLGGDHFLNIGNWQEYNKYEFDSGADQKVVLNFKDSAEIIKQESVFLGARIAQAFRGVGKNGAVKSLIAAVTVFIAGFFVPRLIGAATCSTMGTGFIFIGMIIVLLHKGSRPISDIYERAAFYRLVAIAMVFFGTVAGLLLYSAKEKRTIDKKDDGER